MTGAVTVVCLVLALVVVVVTGVTALRDRAPDTADVVAAGVLELGVIVYVVVRAVDLAGGHRASSTGLTVAYLVGLVLVMPVTVVLGVAERSRWGAVVVGVGAVVVCVLLARVHQLWTPGG